MRLLLVLSVVYLASTIAVTREAQAQEDKAAAAELIQRGDKALQDGDRWLKGKRRNPSRARNSFRKGLKYYQRAYEAYNSPQIYFAIAMAEKKLGMNLEAIRHLIQFKAEAESPAEALVERVDAEIAELEETVAALVLVVEPEGATISLDGEELGVAPLKTTHYERAGVYEVTASLEGFVVGEKTVELRVGEKILAEIKLKKEEKKVEVAKVDPQKDPAVSAPLDANRSAEPLYVRFGTGGVILLAAGVATFRARQNAVLRSDPELSPAQRVAAGEKYQAYRNSSIALYAGSALLIGAGVHYYFTVYGQDDGPGPEKAGVAFVPQVSREQAGFVFEGSF